MKKFIYLAALVSLISCDSISDSESNSSPVKDSKLKARTGFSAIWDICRPCSEGNATFRITQIGVGNISITPTCGSPNCVDDGSGTICSQASITITISGSTLTWNSGTCTLNLPSGYSYTARQISSGTCNTHGFDWSDSQCTGTPMGDIYIKSQVYPDCTPYVTNTTCIQLTER